MVLAVVQLDSGKQSAADSVVSSEAVSEVKSAADQ